ncbi:MAG: OmpA-related protein [Rhodanobacteraceae bacterium]|jgi:outer membrane receptor protein involved in Fe transport|nr:MAG: OmpA-related protein [Rhodanobacteraceae bacterium]
MKNQTRLRKKLLAALVTSSIAAGAALPTMVWAQTANATLQGNTTPNAQVTARNVATGMVRVTKANAQGRYVLVGLPPGTWHVDAGPGTAQTITLSVASTATLNLTAAAAPTAPTAQTLAAVQVTASPLLDVKTSQVGNTVSLHQIQTLPQTTRNFLEFADIVPGMIFTTNSQGNTSLQGGAQNTSAVNVYIDGVGQKSYVMGGGVSGQFATQGNPFPELAVDQYRVITSNYKAEYDQLSSAAVTAVTKSGTNQFHGEVYGNYTDDSYRDMTPSEKASGQKTPSESKEYGFSLGGPIIQDKMHYFITDSVKRFDSPVAVVPGVTGVSGQLPTDAQSQLGPANNPFFENLFFGKLDWEITDSDRLELRAQVRNETQDGNIGGVIAASAGIQIKNTDKRYEFYWEHSADAWYNEFLLTYENAFYVPQQITSGVGQAYTYGSNNQLVLQTGAPDPRAEQNKGQKGPGLKDDLTFTDLHWLGDHTVKVGFKYKDVKLTAQDAGNATAQAYYNVCTADAADNSSYCPPGFIGTSPTPYKAVFAVTNPGFSPIVTSKDQQFGLYAQDDWAVNEHLTFNIGVRWDYEKNPSYLNWVTPANVVNALLNGHDPNNTNPSETYAQQLAAGGININDYISTGNNRKAYKGEWQPRVGFSYDINGDQKHVIFGGAGRAYDRDLYNYLQLEQTKFALEEPTVWFSGPNQTCEGTPCFPWDPSYASSVAALQSLVTGSTAGYEVDMFTNKLKVPYSDQFSIGMRNKLGDWNTSATIVRALSYDGLAATLGNRYPNGAFWMNGGQPWGDGVPGFGPLILWNNGIETRSTQFLLSLEKPYTHESHWGATIAYTYTNASQNRDINEHYSFDQATIQQYPFILSNAAPKHRLVATAVVDGPWDTVFSAKLTLATPTPYDGFINYNYPATAPNGANNLPVGGIPSGGKRFFIGGPIWGYRDIDLAAIKNFRIAGQTVWYLRLDVLNAFNYKNLVDVNSTYPTFYPISYVTNGNITGVPRTFKFTMGVRW